MTSFETFAAQFKNCCEYNKWTEADSLAQLKASLTGVAAQALWDSNASDISSLSSLLQLLRGRFGSEQQSEKFRTELRMRRRKTDESLTSLFADIKRLMALSYPGLTYSAMETIARDCFLDALDDPLFALKVRERDLLTLNDALQVALRLEALEKSVNRDSVSDSNKFSSKRVRSATSATADESTESVVVAQLNEIKLQLDRDRNEFRQRMTALERGMRPVQSDSQAQNDFVSKPRDASKASSSDASSSGNFRRFQNEPSGRKWTGGRQSRPYEGCFRCGSLQHKKRDCIVSETEISSKVDQNLQPGNEDNKPAVVSRGSGNQSRLFESSGSWKESLCFDRQWL